VVDISAGRWTTYQFPAYAHLKTLRIDPSDVTGAICQLSAIRLRNTAGAVRSLPLSSIGAWYKAKVDFQPPGADGVARFAMLQGGGYAMGEAKLNAGAPSLPILPATVLSGPGFLCGLLLFGIVLLLSVQPWPSWRMAAVAAITGLAVAVPYSTARYLEGTLKILPPTAAAVGYTAFYAYPKPGQAVAIMLALALGLAAATTTAWLIDRRQVAWLPAWKSPGWTYRDGVFLAVCISLFACAALPHSLAAYQAALQVKQAVDFDSQNILFWNYLAAHGKLPFRDFWYPYSGSYNEGIPLYPYLAYGWLEKLLVFSVSAFSTYICLSRSRLAALSLWAVLFLMGSANLFWPAAVWRYMLSASIILFGAAVLEERNRWMAAAFGLWTAHVASEELSQAIYAMPAIVILYGSVLWRHRKKSSSYLPQALAATAGCAVGFGIHIGLLAARGQLAGWLAFIRELPSATTYSGWPLDFGTWLGLPRDLQQLYLLTVVLLLTAGAIQAVASRFECPVLLVPLGLGLVCALHLQKEVVRPGISTQLLPVSALGIVVLVAQQMLLAGRPRRAILAAGYCGAGLLAAFFLCDPPARAQLRDGLDVWTGKAGDLSYTLAHAQEWAKARERFFSPEALFYDGTPGTVLRSELFHAMGESRDGDIYVLGDRADLYLLLNKPAPYYITFYNQSPIQAQERTVSWLRKHDPAFVLWDPTALLFDQVPNIVRVPLLFRQMVSHYVPAGELRGFQILRRRRAGEPADIAYWRHMLGDTLDLGYIPALSSAGSAAVPAGRVRDRYLLAEVDSAVEGRVRTIPLLISGEKIGIQFTERAKISRYWINLERLPWMDLQSGLPAVIPQQERGLTTSLKILAFKTEPLY